MKPAACTSARTFVLSRMRNRPPAARASSQRLAFALDARLSKRRVRDDAGGYGPVPLIRPLACASAALLS